MTETRPTDAASGEPTFEDALGRLEQIVHELEEGQIGLSEALGRYEEGVALLRQSYDLLRKAERRIELLSGIDAEGNPVTTAFDDSATFSAEDPPPAGRRRGRRPSGD